MFEGKKVLITGGTGSLGKALTKKILETDVKTIRIFSRDEWKQSQMESDFNDDRLRFLIGDVRDKDRLSRACEEIDIVIHAAALKHVPVAEYNPFEAVKTNVHGSQNLIDACLENSVSVALAVGTDKAVSPLNTYGATKLLMERLFVSANFYKGSRKTKFLCVRYGNVLGSRGSLVPKLIQQISNNEKLTITNPNMTRFNITMEQALELVFRAIKNGSGGEIFIPKLKAYKVGDMKNAITELMDSSSETHSIPIRAGEKLHESLINHDEIRKTFETDEDYVLIENHDKIYQNEKVKSYKITSLKEQYSSDKVLLLTCDELKKILLEQNLIKQ